MQRRILGVLVLLRGTPRPPAAKSLVGHPNYLRVRTGDYRIVYTIEEQRLLVVMLALGHRRAGGSAIVQVQAMKGGRHG